jgi:type IV pilus biogenesis protein CpaD/CtpE
MHEDLKALRSVTERERPDPEQTMRAARLRADSGRGTRKEWLMSAVTVSQRRPWLATAFAVVALALVLLAVPVSYERTIGHQVNLTIAGALEPAQVGPIAREFQAALGVDHVSARLENGATVLGAFLPTSSRSFSPALAQAFAKELSAKGYQAKASTEAVKEKTSGNVYAYALNQVIKVESNGKTAAQLESEIRQQLAQAGVQDAHVSVTDDAGGRKVEVNVQRQCNGSSPPCDGQAVPQLQITKNGVPMGGQGLELRIEKMKSAEGMVMKVEAIDGSRTATATVKNPDSLGDAGLAAEIQRQLSAQGITARVTVQDGKVSIEK